MDWFGLEAIVELPGIVRGLPDGNNRHRLSIEWHEQSAAQPGSGRSTLRESAPCLLDQSIGISAARLGYTRKLGPLQHPRPWVLGNRYGAIAHLPHQRSENPGTPRRSV